MFNKLSDFIQNFLLSIGLFAPIFSCLLIVVESMVPILPLCVFITINFYYFGSFFGFLISYIFTCIGSFISYILVKKWVKILAIESAKKTGFLNNAIKIIKKIEFPTLVTIIAIPFTPAFMVNIAAGLAKLDTKKYLISLLIGKIFMVYFWGFVGVSLIESLKNPYILIKVAIMVLTAYLIAIITKKFIKEK